MKRARAFRLGRNARSPPIQGDREPERGRMRYSFVVNFVGNVVEFSFRSPTTGFSRRWAGSAFTTAKVHGPNACCAKQGGSPWTSRLPRAVTGPGRRQGWGGHSVPVGAVPLGVRSLARDRFG